MGSSLISRVERYAAFLRDKERISSEEVVQGLGVDQPLAQAILRVFGYAATSKGYSGGKRTVYWEPGPPTAGRGKKPLQEPKKQAESKPQPKVRPKLAERKESVKFALSVPLCTDQKAYELWKLSARANFAQFGFCTDCNPGRQARMKAADRCENPHVKFRDDGEKGTEGYVP